MISELPNTLKKVQQWSRELEQFHFDLFQPYYVSPEVILGHYSEKCDVWSCGVILYVMLRGKTPFHGKNEKELLNNIVNSEITFTDYQWNDISGEAKEFLKMMMNHDPDARLPASTAILNPWITSLAPSHHINSALVQSISEMHDNLKLKNAILAFISSQVPLFL